MTDQKYVDFDYQRYLEGDEVFFRNEEKFEGEIFFTKNKKIILNDIKDGAVKVRKENGRFHSEGEDELDLVMTSKTTKLYVAIGTESTRQDSYETSRAYLSIDSIKENGFFDDLKKYKIIEIDMET